MKVLLIVLIVAAVLIYIEFAIYTAVYMYIRSSKAAEEENKKELRMYSVIAGIFFPITFAILQAYKKAEGGEGK